MAVVSGILVPRRFASVEHRIIQWHKLGNDVRVVYEGPLIDPVSSIQKVGQALDAGCIVSIAAVLPRTKQALEFSFGRFVEYGRGAGVGVMARIHENTSDGLSTLLERFGDKGWRL